jgi:predicted nuclease of predicted toxin-antitoxin system
VKLLLDAMFDPEIANRLRGRGHDATAASGDHTLDSLLDADLFAFAQAEQRAVVTENVPDFLPLDELYRAEGRPHHGLILTTNSGFPRSSPATLGRLVLALEAFLRDQPPEPLAESIVHWLH